MERSDDEQVFFPGLAMDSDSEPDQAQSSQAPPGQQVVGTPHDVLWLWYLYFQPKRFFEHFVTQPMPFLTALCAWIYGMAGVIDRIEMRHVQGRLPVDQLGMTGGWGSYIAIVLLGGAFAGVLYYAIGGWWYRKRLTWCGVQEAEPGLARRVYLYASQVLAGPVVLSTLAQSTAFDTPVQMMEADGVWVLWVGLSIVGFALWSVWTSYRGVTTLFETTRRGMTRLWFLILPGFVYGVIFAVFFTAGVLMAKEPATQLPDLDNPKAFHGSTVRFGYPGNWAVGQSGTNPEWDFQVGVRPDQDAMLAIEIYTSKALPEEELALIVSSLRRRFDDWRDEYLASRWGKMRGVGVRAVADAEGDPYRITVLIVPLASGRYLAIRQLCLVRDEPLAQPGFELIKKSFKISRRLVNSPTRH